MGYLICNNCDIYYEVEDEFDIESFETCEYCGDNLNLYNSFDDYYNEYPLPNRESIVFGKGYAEKKSSKYNIMVIVGIISIFIGLIGALIGFTILIIFSFLGFLLVLYGYGSGMSWNKGIKGEAIVAEYLNELPKDYFIFNDVKFPGSWGNLDHIIVGPNGVFVIETKNLSGFYVVEDSEWKYKKNIQLNPLKRSLSQPGKQVLANTKALKNFLDLNGINVAGLEINSIVSLIKNNYKIKIRPNRYNIVNPSSIPEFIINIKKRINPKILNSIAVLIELYCMEITYIQGQYIENKEEIIDQLNSFDIYDILFNDPKSSKRAHIAYLMGESRDKQYIDILCEGTKDEDSTVRCNSISSLGKIGDIKAEHVLVKLLTIQIPKLNSLLTML